MQLKKVLYNVGAVVHYVTLVVFVSHAVSLLVHHERPTWAMVSVLILGLTSSLLGAWYKWDKIFMRIKCIIAITAFTIALLLCTVASIIEP